MPGTDQYVGKAAYGYNSCPDSGALQKCTSCWPEDGVVSISLESTRLEKSEQSKKGAKQKPPLPIPEETEENREGQVYNRTRQWQRFHRSKAGEYICMMSISDASKSMLSFSFIFKRL